MTLDPADVIDTLSVVRYDNNREELFEAKSKHSETEERKSDFTDEQMKKFSIWGDTEQTPCKEYIVLFHRSE